MAQYLNPFTGKPLGWDDGENGWGQPLNSTLIQYAFYHNKNVKGIIASPDLLPSSPLDGDAYLVVSNARVYYYSKQWYNDNPPDGMRFRLTTTGKYFIKQGASFVQEEEFSSIAYSGNAGDLTGKLSYHVIPEFIGDVTKPENSAQFTLVNSGVVAGNYGLTSGLSFPRITVDAKGRIINAVNQVIPTASNTNAGLMSAEDKIKIDSAVGQVNADWNSISGVSQILNKPLLGTSASRNVVTSFTDTTANRVVTTGWMGLGASINELMSLESLISTQFFSAQSGNNAFLPSNWYGEGVNIAGESPSTGMQLIGDHDNQKLGVRFKKAGNWSDLRLVYHSGNMIDLGLNQTTARTALGLGTAATAALSTSNTLGSVGSVMRVGDFGAGSVNAPTSNADSNTRSGIFLSDQSSTDSTMNSLGTVFLHAGRTSGTGWQIYTNAGGGVGSNTFNFFGRKTSGTSGDWGSSVEFLHTGNSLILGNTATAARTALGLGTAALGVVTTSRNDTTIGRVLRVEDFGLGKARHIADLDISDARGFAPTGLYTINSTSTNRPSGVTYGGLWNICYSNTSSVKMAIATSGYNFWFTSSQNDDWAEVLHSQNSLKLGTTASAARGVLEIGTAAPTSTTLGYNNLVMRNGSGDSTFRILRATNNITFDSDRRKKENIVKIENALTKLSQLNGVTFRWKESQLESAGVIAQEVQDVLSVAVTESDDGVLSVSSTALVGLLIEAVKELKQEVDLLKGGL